MMHYGFKQIYQMENKTINLSYYLMTEFYLRLSQYTHKNLYYTGC